MNETRTSLTKRNAKASIFNRMITLVCNFICRSVFIKILGGEYLGAGGMFGNVFSVISLCELGFGEAVSQAMYKPLATGKREELRKILAYFSRVYRVIALISVTFGMMFMPFLPRVFQDIEKIENYRAVYVLFVVHQTLSYYFASKQALVRSDQRLYAIMNIHTVSSVLVTVTQIFFLYKTKDYLIYIFLRILFLAMDGFAVNFYADRRYDFLKSPTHTKTEDPPVAFKKHIWKNTRALLLHRIGGVINSSTDSLLISAYMGLSHMGVFSNYSLVINSLGSFVALAVGAASASVGNLGVTVGENKSVRVLRHLCFANFILLTNCAALLLNLVTPFIAIWLGSDKCFGAAETAIIIACFYMSYIRDPVQMYIHSYGVFSSTGKLYLVRGICNFAFSVILVKKLGAVGVFAGTLVSTVLTAFIFEPLLLFKAVFSGHIQPFAKEYFSYPMISGILCTLSVKLGNTIPANTVFGLFLRGCAVAVLINLVLILIYGRSDRFKAVLRLLKHSRG